MLNHFSELEDPRCQHLVLHPARNIIYITLTAVICGVRGWEEIEDFANARREFFAGRLDLSNGIPSHDTINRFFQAIDRDTFARCFMKWTASIAEEVEHRTVCIDGKTIRRASRMSENEAPIHVLSAWASENRMVLAQVCLDWQEDKDKQENEILVIPELIDMLDLKGDVVTIDAIGTQVKIVESIAKKEADYVLCVKANQPTLMEDIARYFDSHPGLNSLVLNECDHGRIEQRSYSLSTDLSYLADVDRWENLAAIVKVHSRSVNKKTGLESEENRYFITSLTDVDRAAEAIRKHWGVESMHWSLDVTFGEDGSAKRALNAAVNFDVVCKVAFNLLKNDGYQHRKKNMSIKRKMLQAILDEEYLTYLLAKL